MTTLISDKGAGESMTHAGRDALCGVDLVLAENAGPLKDTIANFKVFSLKGCLGTAAKLDGIVAGL